LPINATVPVGVWLPKVVVTVAVSVVLSETVIVVGFADSAVCVGFSVPLPESVTVMLGELEAV
jgi:hypothetical protein